MQIPNDDNGWSEWRKYVLKALDANEGDHKAIMEVLTQLRTDVAQLQVKAGMWGLLAGSIPVIVAILLRQL